MSYKYRSNEEIIKARRTAINEADRKRRIRQGTATAADLALEKIAGEHYVAVNVDGRTYEHGPFETVERAEAMAERAVRYWAPAAVTTAIEVVK